MEIYGYARVSSKEQNLERQIAALKEFGIAEKYIFCDKASGKDFNRKAYNSLVGTKDTLAYLHKDDLLVIYSIDRLGRNYEEIQNEWKKITKEIGANIKVLDMPLLDTRNEDGRDLDKTFIADLVLQILSYVAEKERANIKSRQQQGIAVMPVVNGKKVSLKTGKATGRPSIEYPDNWKIYYDEWKNGNITATKAMELLELKRNSFYNLVKRYENNDIVENAMGTSKEELLNQFESTLQDFWGEEPTKRAIKDAWKDFLDSIKETETIPKDFYSLSKEEREHLYKVAGL